MTGYMAREVGLEMSLILPRECSVECKLDVDTDDVMDHVRRVLDMASQALKEMLKTIDLPTDGDGEDCPMVQVSLEYFEYSDETYPESNFKFSTCMTEVIDGNADKAIFKASADAFSFFNHRIARLTHCVAG